MSVEGRGRIRGGSTSRLYWEAETLPLRISKSCGGMGLEKQGASVENGGNRDQFGLPPKLFLNRASGVLLA